ncbi:glycosyltransferase family 2 protein [Anabaena sp. CCY 9402-a]|uniref:glycosyltransferase family 2 protein n=1 Tax=Anabaena sp. CCY 9402-a TaxID=3103867 RepID=UPI0039C6894E
MSTKKLEPKNTPSVAVIVPLYNKGQYIARTLKSILNQTYQNFEIIVVNDGSTDNSPDIVSSYHDPRIKLIHQANVGPGAARNRGMSETQADFLSFLDADDEWLPSFLATSIKHLQTNPDCLLSVTGHFRGVDCTSWQQHLPHLKVNQGVWRLPTNTKPKVVKSAIDLLHSGAVVCARKVIEKFGGFYYKERCTYGEDSYLWLQVLLNYQIYIDPTPLMWHHTEASVLGHGRKEAHPPWPKLTDTATIRKNCPTEYLPLLEHCLAYYALLAAERRIRAGDIFTAQKLLQNFPLTQTFGLKNIKTRCRLKLTQLLNK